MKHSENSQTSNEAKKLYIEKVKLLYANTAGSTVATLINSSILTLFLWNVISHSILILWLACNVLITVFRFLLVYKYRYASAKSIESKKWGEWLIAGIAFNGIVWGLGGIFLFSIGSIPHQAMLAFVIAGMVAGSLGTYSVIKKAFLVYCIPASIPIMIKFLTMGEDIQLAMGGMTFLFILVMLVTAKRMNKMITTSLKLQFKNISLIDSLTENKRQTEKLNKELKSEIKEREKTEKALLKATKESEAANQAKSEFLANMSHELRTPMNGVIASTGLLLDTNITDEQREFIEIIRNSGDSLLALINDILDFSKIEAGKLELEEIDFDLRNTLEDTIDVIAMRAENKGLELTCLIEPDVPNYLQGDPGRLRQIIINLIGNAVKFTSEGEIALRASLDHENKNQAVVRFEVRDTGVGIAKDKLDKLFESFTQADSSTTRQFGGTGLGLTISKQLSKMMGGKIGVESELGKGSNFWFTACLNKQPENKRKKEKTKIKPVGSLKDMRILGVDDNATNRRVLEYMLASWKCDFEVVAHADIAMEKLHQAKKKNNPFRIAILDMQMPGTDGETLGKNIKKDKKIKNTLLVMMTSMGQRGDVKRLEKIGFAAYLAKPVKQSQLFNCLMTVIGFDEAHIPEHGKIITKHTISEDRQRKIRLLLAEDNAVNQKVALKILEKMGYRADAVANGIETIEALKTIPYDLVLMDVQMPEMDGFEATRMIRNKKSKVKNHKIPIIAMTAHAMKGDREKCIAAGMDDYVTKPINPGNLAQTIAKWIPEDIIKPKKQNIAKGSNSNGVFDREGLLERLGGDEEFMNEVLDAFFEQTPEYIQSIETGIKEKNSSLIERPAHTIKGSAGNICAIKLQDAALKLEMAGKEGDLSNVANLYEKIKTEYDKLKEVINSQKEVVV